MQRAIVKTRAIVLRSRRLGETSKLVTLYTEDWGQFKAVARGARRPQSRFGASLETLSLVQTVLYVRENRDLQTLSEADLVQDFPGITLELERLAYASAGAEMLERLTIDGEANERLFRCLLGLLGALEEVEVARTEVLFWYFQLRVAAALGFRPQLDSCVACDGGLAEEGVGFSLVLGGVVCDACSSRGDNCVSSENLRLLSGLQGLHTYSREVIPQMPTRAREVRDLLRAFIDFHGGVSGPLKSLAFLDSVAQQPRKAGYGAVS